MKRWIVPILVLAGIAGLVWYFTRPKANGTTIVGHGAPDPHKEYTAGYARGKADRKFNRAWQGTLQGKEFMRGYGDGRAGKPYQP